MLYWTCPRCGSNLDAGERCDCERQTADRSETKEKASAGATHPDEGKADNSRISF